MAPLTINAGVLFAIATAVGLGAITTQAKLVYADGGNAYTLMLARFVMSVMVIGVLIVLRGHRFALGRGIRLRIAGLGTIWCGSMIVYLISVQTISVSVAVLLLYTYPVIVLGVGLRNGQFRSDPVLIALFFIAFIGIALALFSGSVVLDTVGIVFAFLAGCGAAYTFIHGSKLAPVCEPVVLTFWVNFTGLFLIIPLVATRFSLPDSSTGLLLLGTATACYIIAIICQFEALARLPATTAAFTLNLEPVVSILLAALILSESLTVTQWVGVVLVLGTLFYSTHAFTRRRVTEPD